MKRGKEFRPVVSDAWKFRLAVKGALLAGMAAGAPAAVAQQAPAQPAAGDESTEFDVLQVTGTRLPQLNVTSTSPVLLVGEEEIKYQGTVNIETLLNSMPQAFAEFSTGDSNGATGTATVNLRGLGSSRTLVLIDGKRLMPGDPILSPSAPNLNFIPAPLVEGIQILTGGASAVYGSDAVAGVVNFIMKKDYEGFRFDTQHGRSAKSDAGQTEYSLLWGSNFAGGSGNVTLYAGYTRLDALTQAERDFSDCSVTTPSAGTTHVCAGSRTIGEGLVYSYDDGYHLIDGGGTRAFIPDDGRTFNFAPFNYFQRPTDRYNLGGFATREVNENLEFYASAMYMDDRTVAAIAPSGLFFVDVTIRCDNPFLSAQQVQELCTDNGYAATDLNSFLFAKRTVELGPREADLRHTDNRIVVGLRGAVPALTGFNYDFSMQRGESVYIASQNGYVNTANARNGMSVEDDGLGNPVCISGDADCVPIDLWQLGQLTPEMIAYMSATGFQQANMIEEVVSLAFTADLGNYGIQLPTASSGVAVALGTEYRSEALNYRPDSLVEQGNLGGGGGPSPAISGRYGVHELFGELRVPIIEGMPGVELLMVDAAYRTSDYSSAGSVSSSKFAMTYAPVKDVSLRASYQRATRAPQVTELFAPAGLGLYAGSDPCAGANLFGNPTPLTEAQCVNTGVTPEQYQDGLDGPLVDSGAPGGAGGIPECIAGQCNGFFGGNANLDVEESTTTSYGLVLTPSMVKGLEVTIDYFDIEVTDAIGIVPPGTALNTCATTGDPFLCSLINRGGSGQIWGEPTNPNAGFIAANNVNLGAFRTQGFDVEANYRMNLADFGMADAGRLQITYVTTVLSKLEVNIGPGLGSYDCSGLYGLTCGTPSPEYRHKLRTTWQSPMNLTLSAQWRYFGATDLDKNQSDPELQDGTPNLIDAELKAKNYLDLSATYALPPMGDWMKSMQLRAGINNVLDTQPQVVSSNNPNPVSSPPFGNGNTFPNVYDVQGTSFFIGLGADF
jgi:iron complex outermembrane receptor protein